MQTLESVEREADYQARTAYDFVLYQPTANAREIAESLDEPAVLIEQIITAMHQPGTDASRFLAIESLINSVVLHYAAEQAEAAREHVMRTPS